MIDPSSIEALKQSIDIVDVIGNYLELKKAGANYKCNCPFHGEKTPSFNVNPQRQIYHCFGCGVGGDAIKFVMEYEKLSYPEAIEKIAAMYNFSLRYTQGKGQYGEAKRVLELMQQFYTSQLDHQPQALEYLRSRGVTQSSIEDFGIGYVPGGEEVMAFLRSRSIPLPLAAEAGIVAQGERGEFYARLNRRVTFPIYSPAGALVGFGGRTLGDHPAKYINSPQTRLFNKSRLLYGYHRAKEHIYHQKELIVCEGYLDVIMLHQAGFRTAVATLGTALTAEHLPLLRKGEPAITLAYDGDSAGVAAALKAARLLAPHGFEGSVVLFPGGQDPADMVHQGDLQGLKKLLGSGTPLIPFVLEKIAAAHDLNNPREKERAFGEARSFLETLSPIIRESYIPQAATLLGVHAALFTPGRNRNRRQEEFGTSTRSKEDPAWQAILRTLLENERLIDEVLDLIDPRMAGEYQEAFQALIQGEREHPRLRGIAIAEEVHPLDEEAFWRTLRAQMERFYRLKLQEITRNPRLPYQEKSYWIRKIKTDILPRLKKGELVPYASDFTL
ncbi:DNA primase [Nitratifractor salsuginis]|uniref:DNA primase n=1 Tax=Nitratifractor salsuginis (strain DSM 16511 / JCM 12458 / E9I37-1) TaxID=749222 RepID=E6X3A2_NITSE|nr:DNA primase [Nitratifractor salsuginis]ADV47315.1 DNA primase [Nitratifractor salsuginis DSM 16511]